MKTGTLATILFLITVAAPAAAAPNASFTARKIQGATCLAPCAVHFDAIGQGALSPTPYVTPETTDPDFSRPFHSLQFVWDFGDPQSGEWTTGAAAATATRASKNSDVGGITGHVYERPGTYTVTLTVTNPNGQSTSTTRQVVVGDRNSHFSPASTFCFANDGNNWSGCPLNCAIDDNCTVTSSLSTALTAGDNCNGSQDCAAATSNHRRVLLRRGDTFSMSNIISMNTGPGPGLVEAFGSGARPIIDMNGHMLWAGDGWTYTELSYRDCGLACFWMRPWHDSLTWFRVDGSEYSGACFDEVTRFDQGEPFTGFARLHAFIEMDCTGSTAAGYGAWPGSDYGLWMGGTLNHDPQGRGRDSSVRSHHTQHYLISHVNFLNASPGRGHIELRQADDSVNGRMPPYGTQDQRSARFVLLSDNRFEENASSGFFSARTCVDSGCNCGEPGGCAGGSDSGNIVPVHDFIFERNFYNWPDGSAAPKFGIYEIQGGGVTIRNNVYDLQAAYTGGLQFVTVTGEPTSHNSGSSPSGNVHVYNNTLYFTQANTSQFAFTGIRNTGDGCPSGCFSRNNLLVAPSFTGSLVNSSAFTSSNNLLLRSPNPFATTVPARGATQISSFALGGGGVGAVDAGYSFTSAANRDAWVFDDAFGGCRGGSTTGPWDVGASEFGAPRCAASGGISPTTLLPPTLLLPR